MKARALIDGEYVDVEIHADEEADDISEVNTE